MLPPLFIVPLAARCNTGPSVHPPYQSSPLSVTYEYITNGLVGEPIMPFYFRSERDYD